MRYMIQVATMVTIWGLMALGFALPAAASPWVSAELRAYPAGLIPGPGARFDLGPTYELGVSAGWNWTRRRDFGQHDEEHGQGLGAGVGVRRALGAGAWFLGVRADIWELNIAWEDDSPARAGNSEITVVQPTAEFGRRWRRSGLRWTAALALGAEINTNTRGEEVGEGAILLLGISIDRDLRP